MALKEFWSQTGRWMRSHNPLVPVAHRPEIGDDGLISLNEDSSQPAVDGSPPAEVPGNEIAVRAVPQVDRHESLEKLQQGFGRRSVEVICRATSPYHPKSHISNKGAYPLALYMSMLTILVSLYTR